jgi:hypothetical protein
VSGIVLAVTFFAIWRQLALQRSAAGYAQVTELSRQDLAEPMLRVKVEILRALRDAGQPTAIPYGAASYVTDFWEDIGVLVRYGHIDGRLLHETMGNMCRRWWATLRPFVEQLRIEAGPRGGEHFEWLADRMADLDRRAGDTTKYDDEYLARTFDNYLRNQVDRLRTAEELRGFVVRAATPVAVDAQVAPVQS